MISHVEILCVASRGAILPDYKTQGASGADICAFLQSPICIAPGTVSIIPTGLRFQIPEGYEIQIRPRSGLAVKNGITCLNTPGTIDSDYRGEIKVILINLGTDEFVVKSGDRIAQIVVAPVARGVFTISSVLDKTPRGNGGFGSTGTGL